MNYLLKTILILTTLIGFQLRSHNNNLGSHIKNGNANQKKVNDTIVLGYKQTYYNLENNYSLTWDSILNDSRCPIGVECIWEGNAEVQFILKMRRHLHFIVLNTYESYTNDTVIDNINFRLVELTPLQEVPGNIDQKDWVVKIKVEKQ